MITMLSISCLKIENNKSTNPNTICKIRVRANLRNQKKSKKRKQNSIFFWIKNEWGKKKGAGRVFKRTVLCFMKFKFEVWNDNGMESCVENLT